MTLEDLIRLLKTTDDVNEIDQRRMEIADLLPGIEIMYDYNQQNSAHQYDLWQHSIHTVINLKRGLEDDMLYLAALLHDIGKPACQCKGRREEDTNMHYYGHPEKSMEIVRDKQGIYYLPKENISRLLYYIQYHDDHAILDIKYLKNHLQLVSFKEFQNLMLLQVADAKAHVQIPIVAERVRICEILSGDYTIGMFERL